MKEDMQQTPQNGMKPPMKKKPLWRRYLFAAVMIAVLGAVLLIDVDTGKTAVNTMLFSLKEMATVLPPIFILLGLLDVWVPRETMVRFMGEGSGLKGILLAIILGSAAAGPLYAAFPVAAMFMRKGAKFSNVVLFLGAWSTTKVPMVAFELASLGPVFALTRLGLSIVGIALIALVMNRMMSKDEVAVIYARAKEM